MSDAASLRLLKTEILNDLEAAADIRHRLDPVLARIPMPDATQGEVVHAAYLLHNVYNAWESILRRVATAFENELKPDQWHEALLRRMTLTIPGVRPAVIDERLRAQLDELRKFRHFFRHSYAVKLEAGRIEALGDRWRAIDPAFRQAVGRFLEILDDMITRSS